MSTLTEIEAAADALTIEQKRELLVYLISSLRAEGNLPNPEVFSKEEVQHWIAEDEADMRRFSGEK